MKQKDMKTIYKIATIMLIFAAVAIAPVKAQIAVLPSETPNKLTENIAERAPFEETRGPLFVPPGGGGDANRETEAPVSGGIWILAGLAGIYGISRRKKS